MIERAACLPSSTALDGEILAAENAVAAGPHALKAGAPLAVDDDAPVLKIDRRAFQRLGRAALSDGGEQHVGLDAEDGAVRGEFAFVLVGVLEQRAAEHARMALERDRTRPGADDDAARLGELALEQARLHLLRAAAIDDRHVLRPEPLRLDGDVDRRHAAADDDDPAADGQRRQVARLPQRRDVGDRVDHVLQLALVRQAELVGRPEADRRGTRRHSRGAGRRASRRLPRETPYRTSMPPIDKMKAASFAAKPSTVL